MRDINYSNLPEHMIAGTKRYIEHGINPGSFLTAVICNDLMGAMGKADDFNRAAMWDWVNFFYNDTPSTCWGSPKKMEAWIEKGGMKGRD